MENNWLILDTETTGVSGRDQIIDLAYLSCSNEFGENFDLNNISNFYKFCEFILGKIQQEYFNPTVEINSHAFKVHNLSKIFLRQEAKKSSKQLILPECVGIVAHNVAFDYRMLGKPKVKIICTLKLARKLLQDLQKHDLETLINHFYPDKTSVLLRTYHTAKNDCLNTILVLVKLLEKIPNIKTFLELHEFLGEI